MTTPDSTSSDRLSRAWPASELRITASQADFLAYGGVRAVSPAVAALTEGSLSRRKMIAWHRGRDGFYLCANDKGRAALERYRRAEERRDAANDNNRMEERE